MAQHDYNIANQTGANFRADLNNALSAIATNNSGSSEPSTTFAYEWWIDTSANVLKLRNSANNAWITMPFSITADNTIDINAGTVNGITSLSFSSGATVTSILDEDNLASDSATALATQQSIKAYVDSQVTAQDLDISDGSSTIDIDLDSETLSLLGGTGVTSAASGNGVTFSIGQSVGTSDNVVFNQVTGALVGNASTATALATARTINGTSFDGTANISFDTDSVSEGSSNLYHTTARVQAISIDNVVEDTTPQLGGNLDVNGQDIVSVSNGNITLSPNGTGVVRIDGSTGVDIQQGAISIKNGGTQSYIDFYCEASNAHYARLQAPAHASFSGNITLTLPATTGTMALLPVVLGTDTNGNYVSTIAGTSNEIEVSGSGSETANVTIGLPDDVTITNNLTVSGNLTVTGTTTQTGSVVTDSNFQGFTDNNTGNSTDFGFYGKYVESSTTKYAGLFFDASTDNTFRLFTDTQTKPSTTVNTGATGYAVAGLVANLTGNVTGDVTGNADTATALATGRTIALSGDVTATGVSFDGTGNISLSTTISANSVALGTDTTGNYVSTISGTTNEIDVSGSGSETATVTIGLPDDVTIAGNLTVNGTTTTVNSDTLSVTDPLIKLAKANSGADSLDIGFYGLYDTSGSQDLYAGLFRDANDSGKFKLFKDLQVEPTTTVNTSGTGYAVGTLVSNLEGNVTGNVSGSSGSTTGNAATATALETARTIGGVSFDGTGNIDLAGVNTTGNQDTSGNSATATALATGRTIGMTGDVVWTSASFDGSGNVTGTATIQANSVALGTDTTGDYVGTITGGTGIDSSGATSGEGIAHTLSIDLNELGTETSIAQDDFVAMVDATDDGSGKITFSNLEDEIFGNVSGDIAIAAGGAATIQANSVALGTDTTGDYVSTITGGTGITSTGATSGEGIAHSLSVDASQTQITSVGALDAGSITSGFGSIDVGSSAITTSGTVTGGTLAGTLSTAAQTNITSVGTLTSFRSTGIDDNADALAITIDSSERVGVICTDPTAYLEIDPAAVDTAIFSIRRQDHATIPLFKIVQDSSVSQGAGHCHITSSNRDMSITAGENLDKTKGLYIKTTGNVGIGTVPTAPFHVKSATTDIAIFENTDAGTTGSQLLLYQNSSSPADNDRVGALGFLGNDDGGNQLTYGAIRCLATDVSNGSEDGAFTFSTTKAGSFTEHMRIDSSGNLGIGTSSPSVILHTSTSSDNVGRFESTDATAYIQINDTADSFYLATGTQIGSIGGNAGVNANNLNIDLTNGRVGIGVTSMSAALHVKDQINLTNADNHAILGLKATRFGYSSTYKVLQIGDGTVSTHANIAIGVDISGNNNGSFTGSGEAIYFRNGITFRTPNDDNDAFFRYLTMNDGDLIIGGTSFEANGAISIRPNGDDGASIMVFDRDSTTSTSDVIRFKNNGSTVGSINYNNSSTTYATSSDARLKNVLGEAKGLEIVNKLNPVNFEWKESKKVQDGLIAQEVEKLIPHAVAVSEEGHYSMDYSQVVTPLIKAIQEQQEEIEQLKRNSHPPKSIQEMDGYDELIAEIKKLKGE